MKIKTDFITNSSSTSYILSSTVSGHLPRLGGSYQILEEFYGKDHFLYEGYGHIRIVNEDEEVIHYDDKPICDIDLQMQDGYRYEHENTFCEIPITFFQLKVTTQNPYSYPQEDLVKEWIETLLFKQLKATIQPSQLFYFAHPSKVYGDGWDGGDPQGPSHEYTYRYDLYKGETKMGIFNIINSTIIPEIRNITKPLDFNEMVLENLNTEGFCLEEQNDKNS
jgi:hypothetical protein